MLEEYSNPFAKIQLRRSINPDHVEIDESD
jgi:hypothetical protein